VISVSHLTREFGSLRALDDVSFEVERGEVVGVLGPNGAGKTTLLRILAGYLPATSGGARIAGFDTLRRSLEVRRRIGYLPESVPLYREHRVIEMLEFQGRLHGLSRIERKQRIPRVLERVGLADRSRDLIGGLSRGLRQRAGLAVALLPEPEVLILDEPTSGLDPLQRIEVRNVVRELAERHTILLSSHILPEVEAVCPRVIILHKGKIAADGTREELVSKLARASHVRLEAVIGPDVQTATRLLRGVAGVRDVADRGRRGIHHEFDVECEVDLREELGALAAQRGWALRELSWRRPTLEEIFARIALSLVDETATSSSAPAPLASSRGSATGARAGGAITGADSSGTAAGASGLEISMPQHSKSGAPSNDSAAGSTAPAKRVVYNLNPFDMGASRELGKPKAVEGSTPVQIDPAPRSARDGGSAQREPGSTACEPTDSRNAAAPPASTPDRDDGSDPRRRT
jgi:ABC-2 type transport system ATP-binding protein